MLIEATGLNEHDLRAIIRNAPIRYKRYTIKKRNGGDRTISQPASEVKALQRALLAGVLNNLQVHRCATAYRPGISILNNALPHARSGVIMKFDFKNFFPSIRARDWEKYCENVGLFEDPEDIQLSTKILFHQMKKSVVLRLAIGAPSSPHLSNILMRDFDEWITKAVTPAHVTYTRYADDLTFSAHRTGFLTGVKPALARAVREIKSPRLTINEDKTVVATNKYRRQVTGLILTNDGTVSIGHERKRNLRAAVHRCQLGLLNGAEEVKLAGLLAFVHAVEPDFLERLKQKYSEELINRIQHFRQHGRARS
jgi:RNA-directed DNA polymerase